MALEFHAHTDKGYFYAANRYSVSEHDGTTSRAHPFRRAWQDSGSLPVEQRTGTRLPRLHRGLGGE